MNKEKMYELAKKHFNNRYIPIPEIEEFEYGTVYDETEELKTKCITDRDGFLIDEYDYIETIRFALYDYLVYTNEQYKIIIRYPYDWSVPEDKEIEIEISVNRKTIHFDYE